MFAPGHPLGPGPDLIMPFRVLTILVQAFPHIMPLGYDLAVGSTLRLFYVTTLTVVHICWPYHPTLAPSPPGTGS